MWQWKYWSHLLLILKIISARGRCGVQCFASFKSYFFFSEWRWTVSKLRLEVIKLRLSPHSSLSFLITLWSTTAVILMSMMLNFVLLLMSLTHSSGQLIHTSLLGISLALNGKFQVYSLCTLPAFQVYFQSESGQCYFLKAK